MWTRSARGARGRRLPAMGGMRPLVIVEGHPTADPGLGLRAGRPCVQVNAVLFQRTPKPFDKDVVDAAPVAVR
jgi:hypothetical protein